MEECVKFAVSVIDYNNAQCSVRLEVFTSDITALFQRDKLIYVAWCEIEYLFF